MTNPGNYRFKRVPKTGKKGRRGQTKAVRIGARNIGASGQHGTIRRPY